MKAAVERVYLDQHYRQHACDLCAPTVVRDSKLLTRKQPMSRISTEKGSLHHKRSQRDCGFLLKNTVDVSLDDDGVRTL